MTNLHTGLDAVTHEIDNLEDEARTALAEGLATGRFTGEPGGDPGRQDARDDHRDVAPYVREDRDRGLRAIERRIAASDLRRPATGWNGMMRRRDPEGWRRDIWRRSETALFERLRQDA